MMATRVVDVARVRAAVNRAHIEALKARLRRKQIWEVERKELVELVGCWGRVDGWVRRGKGCNGYIEGKESDWEYTVRIRSSTGFLEGASPRVVEMALDQEEVMDVVVLLL